MQENKFVAVCFNEHGMMLTENGALLRLDISTTDPKLLAKDVHDRLTHLYGSHMLGDLVYSDNHEHGMMLFLSDQSRGEWTPIGQLPEIDKPIILHLQQTLMNPNLPQMGNCYENTTTGEAYYIINLLSENGGGKRFMLIESTMADEPMVLPTDAFWGMPMRWIPHVRMNTIMQKKPETLIDRAKEFAIRAHNQCNQRYQGKPYSYHLSQVIEVHNDYKHLLPEEDREQVEAELWVHDVLEDTQVTYNDMKKELGVRIADGAWSMTNDQGRNRSERNSPAYYQRLAADVYGEYKKLCDRLANVRNSKRFGHSMGEQYKKELVSFESNLRMSDRYALMWNELKENLL